jgi:transposase-like protein
MEDGKCKNRRKKFTPQFKDEAVKIVVELFRPIAEVAREVSYHEGTQGNWCVKYRGVPIEESSLSVSERVRLRELEARSVSCG